MEVIKERLEREFDLDLIATAPTVTYEVVQTDGQILRIQNPSQLPFVSCPLLEVFPLTVGSGKTKIGRAHV